MDCQELYDHLNTVLDDELTGNEFNVWYAKNDIEDEHLFVVGGAYDSIVENPFEPFSDFVDKYNPDKILLDSSADGLHFTFGFDDGKVSNAPPESAGSLDRVPHRGTKPQFVDECTNCRRTMGGTPYPPLKLMFPTEDKFSEPETEEHHLCVHCSPGHYDDVARNVDFFGVEDSRVSRIGFIETDDSYGSEEWIEWISREDMDNPFIEDTIEAIETNILE